MATDLPSSPDVSASTAHRDWPEWLDEVREVVGSHGVAVRLALAGLASLVAAWAVASLWWPYGGDQGCFSYLGDTLLRGGLPYREAWDFKGPLGFYVFAALQLVFGRQMWAVRVLDLGLLLAAGFASARIVERFASRPVAIGTALLIALAFASFGNWYTAQPDGWAALVLVVVADRLLVPARASTRSAAIAALAIGACTLIKPLYAAYFVLVVCALWPSSRVERPAAARGLGIATVSFALPIATMMAWLASRGVLSDMLDVHVRFNLERLHTDPHLQMSLAKTLSCVVGLFSTVPILTMVLPPAVVGAGYLLRERRRAGVFMILWVVVSVGLIAAQKKFLLQNYSWHPLYPPLGLLAAVGLGRLWRESEVRPVRWLVVATVLLLSKQITREPLAQVGRWLRFASGRITLAQYRSEFDVNVPALNGGSAIDVGFSVARDVELAGYFRERTSPGDEVSVWIDPLVNYLGDRPAITPITVAAAFTTWGSPERRSRYRADLLSRMTSERAKYFGVPARDLEPGTDEDNLPAHFPELVAMLDTRYERAGVVGDVVLFRHRETR